MQIAIVDDVREDRFALTEKLTEYANRRKLTFQITEFESAEAILAAFNGGGFGLVFMDIYMGGMDGMTAARELFRRDRDCKIIFLTSTSDFSLQSYAVRAVYYLVKPLSDAEFLQAMEFCAIKPDNEVPLLQVSSNGISLEIATAKILYIDFCNRETRLHMAGQVLSVSGTFSEVTAPLEKDERFLLCIRGVMVNMGHITRQDGDVFLMSNGERLPINIRNKKIITQTYRRFVYGSLEV